MKCPACNGTGEIKDDALVLSASTTGLANRFVAAPPTNDKVTRIMSSVKRAEAAHEVTRLAFSLRELRLFLRFIHARGTVSSQELSNGLWNLGTHIIAARRKTLQMHCHVITRELDFKMLIEKSKSDGDSMWSLTPLGDTIAAPIRTPHPVSSGEIIDV